jgi:hypothetical protein
MASIGKRWRSSRRPGAKARERENHFIFGRATNTQGWLYQEFGDFARARELDTESADLGHRIKNGNVEISALINLCFDRLHQGDAAEALPRFEETLVRAPRAFGSHRWRWSIHLMFGVASALIELGRDGEALADAERGLTQAEATGSRKYVGWFDMLRGQIALRAGDAAAAVAALREAVTTARGIGYPTLTWRAAELLAQAEAARGQAAEAFASATLARDTIDRIAAAAPEPELRTTFDAWQRVAAVHDTLERLRRG